MDFLDPGLYQEKHHQSSLNTTPKARIINFYTCSIIHKSHFARNMVYTTPFPPFSIPLINTLSGYFML